MDTRAVIDESSDSGVAHGDVLAHFVTEVHDRQHDDGNGELGGQREAVRQSLGDAGLVDACGVIAHFNMMTRMADGAGIPLDAGIQLATHDLRRDMGIDDFPGSEARPSTGFFGRLLGKIVAPLTPWIMRVVAFMANRGAPPPQ